VRTEFIANGTSGLVANQNYTTSNIVLFYLPPLYGLHKTQGAARNGVLETNLQKFGCKKSLLILTRLRKRTKHTKKYKA
jgi:hypothetical protein